MKQVLAWGMAALLLAAQTAWAGSVKIASPADGQQVGPIVTVTVKVEQGGGVDHYHLYLDGEFIKPVMNTPTDIGPMAPGRHTIKVWAATSSHKLLNLIDEVEVVVE